MVMQLERARPSSTCRRDFLNTNGADKHAAVARGRDGSHRAGTGQVARSLREMACQPEVLPPSRGLGERFDATIGAGSVLMPFGGRTPAHPRPGHGRPAARPARPGNGHLLSVMAWGFDPEPMLRRSLCRGLQSRCIDLCGQAGGRRLLTTRRPISPSRSIFEKLRDEPERWGKPFSALLGALDAQLELGAAAIGGKDSMSGTFLDLDVPPTLISFAIAPLKAGEVLSPEFKEAGHPVYLFCRHGRRIASRRHGSGCTIWRWPGKVRAAWAVENGLAEARDEDVLRQRDRLRRRTPTLDLDTLSPARRHRGGTDRGQPLAAVRLGVTTAEPVVADRR